MEAIGKWAFIAGLVIAVLAAFVDFSWVPWVLAILGLIVGFMNVSDDETQSFLIAAICCCRRRRFTPSRISAIPERRSWPTYPRSSRRQS